MDRLVPRANAPRPKRLVLFQQRHSRSRHRGCADPKVDGQADAPLSTCSNAFTEAAGSSLPHTAWHTARKSAPASTSGFAFSGVIPPIATQGISKTADHHVRIDGSGR